MVCYLFDGLTQVFGGNMHEFRIFHNGFALLKVMFHQSSKFLEHTIFPIGCGICVSL